MYLTRKILALPSPEEMVAALTDWQAQDHAVVIGVVGWLLVLLVPLRGADRRDSLAGITYMATVTALGVMSILAVPGRLTAFGDAGRQVGLVIVLATVAGMRWSLRRKPRVIVRENAKP